MVDGRMTAEQVAAALDLQPHPEGGFFRETYRCAVSVGTVRGERSLATGILFMVAAGRPSCLHRLAADELWIHQAGAALELLTIDPQGNLRRRSLAALPASRVAGDGQAGTGDAGPSVPQAVVPAGWWQAARLAQGAKETDWSLVACVVTPGFDYRDFELAERHALLAAYPQLEPTIVELT